MITIIGGGPAGCYTGYLLAKEGHKVEIYEEHSEIGSPVKCAGIVTEDINNILKLDKSLIKNIITKIKVISSEHSLEINSKEIILDRQKFDKYLANLATDAGCKIHLNSRYLNKEKIKVNNKIITVKPEILIGADGPLSRVAKSHDMLNNRRFFTGIQIKAEFKHVPDEYQVHINDLDGFSWIVPESENIARIGLMTQKTDSKEQFNTFLKKLKIKKVLENNTGLIPIYDPKLEIQKNNVYLIGDSATQVKATTGGGIIPSLKAAHLLTKAISKDLNYGSSCYKEIGKQLKLHLLMRNILNKFKEKEYNDLLKMLDKQSIKKLFKNISRERPSMLIPKLMLRQPKLLKYFKCLL
ncbi:MAG: NAD(P)/FAD-dependent oxidoreductase [Nanoarchaeota archaeon]|nr:NAD(P)/FAD-dependent oxidoreductase [Nanoarchaeota archaeon]